MRSTPAAALNAFASLYPIHIQLNEICPKAAIRLASAPPEHPLSKAVIKCARGRKRHVPPLQRILQYTACEPRTIDKWQPKQATKNLPPLVPFPKCKVALQRIEREPAPHKIFADGSASDEGLGSAAVYFVDGVRRVAAGWKHPNEGTRTVLETELVAILIAIHLVSGAAPVDDIVIYSDSQLAIRSLHGQSTGAPRSLLVATQRALRRARRCLQGVSVRLEWSPAHAGVRGNSEADDEAKAAARGRSYPLELLPSFLLDYHPLKDPRKLKQDCCTRNAALAIEHWTSSEACGKIRSRLKDTDPSAFFELVQGLHRSRATLLFRLITGHVALRSHLARIGCVDADRCEGCGLEPETVTHFLLRCPKHATARHEHLAANGREFLSLNFLFFNRDALPSLFSYIKATSRFVDTLR